MNKLFTEIADLVPKLHGWCSVEKAHTLASMVLSLRPEVCLEIGVWGGRSLLPMAMALRNLKQGVIYAIDPWSISASEQGQTGDNQKWWSTANHEVVYNDFVAHVHRTGTEKYVRIYRMKSDDFDPPPRIGILSIDGNHGPQAIKDVRRYVPSVSIGGFVVMDDLDWVGDTVKQAAGLLPDFGFKRLYPLGTGAVYQKIR